VDVSSFPLVVRRRIGRSKRIAVQALTDQEVADLAAYSAAIEFTVKPP
jgi:hypothetical protein